MSPEFTVVYDNNPYDARLRTAWGFSCLVRTGQTSLLFDTGGDGSVLLSNMRQLAIDPTEVSAVVLSHIHSDHVGGLEAFLERNGDVTVYAPMSFPPSFKHNIGAAGAKLVEVHEAVELLDNVHTTGELGQEIVEQSLIVRTAKGLVVITGCAHPGVVAIVDKAKKLLKEDVLLVMGGFHLGGKSEGELEAIVSDFRKLQVRYVGPCHCSGDAARRLFKREYGERFIEVGVGKVLAFGDLK